LHAKRGVGVLVIKKLIIIQGEGGGGLLGEKKHQYRRNGSPENRKTAIDETEGREKKDLKKT